MRLLIGRLAALASACGLVLIASAGTAVADAGSAPTRTPIKHFITLMQENHSFDNYFGTYPGADGIPPGTCMPVDPAQPDGECVKPFPIRDRSIVDLGHSTRFFERQYRDGAMDGFVSAYAVDGNPNADLTMGYYDGEEIPYYWNIADEYVLFDRFFASAKGGSLRNHLYWVTGSAGGSLNDVIPPEGFSDPTIFDRLEEKGISWKFYVENYRPTVNLRNPNDGHGGAQTIFVPILNYARYVDDPKLFSKIVPLEEFYTDLENGTLPAVSYIAPGGSSEHPPSRIRTGETLVRTLVNSLARSSVWESSALMWAYDDWGGWYDHVPPPQVDEFGYGFRVPALLVSPYAKKGHIDSTTLDYTSMLKFIEENWGLPPLTQRDANANNFLSAFDFEQPPRTPAFVGGSRSPQPPRELKGSVVYAAYGSALGLAILAVSTSTFRRLRRRRRAGRRGRAGAALVIGAFVVLVSAGMAAASEPTFESTEAPIDVLTESPTETSTESPIEAPTEEPCDPAPAASPSEIGIETLPPVPGFRFAVDGAEYQTDAAGKARITAVRSCNMKSRLRAVEETVPLPGDARARFVRWYGYGGGGRVYTATFEIDYRTKLLFQEPDGAPISPTEFGTVTMRSSAGTVTTFPAGEEPWLSGTRVALTNDGFEVRTVHHNLERVEQAGGNAVNRSQIRFAPGVEREIVVTIPLFEANIRARDALFGNPLGTSLAVTAPDGSVRDFPLDRDGRVTLSKLQRGEYTLRVRGPVLETPRPLMVSRHQDVELKVISHRDVAALFAVGLLIAVSLAVAGVRRYLLHVGRGPQRDRSAPPSRYTPTAPAPAPIFAMAPSRRSR